MLTTDDTVNGGITDINAPVICTIAAKNYLAYARCLTDSFLEHHPEGQVFFLLVDELDDGFDPAQERFTTVLASEIGIPDFRQMAFRYTPLELCTAVKPFFLEYLFRVRGCHKVCYFDPDIYFHSRLDELLELLDSYGIVLIPHITGFLDELSHPDELDILRSGAYNLGFIGLADHPELDTFLRWWQRKLARQCTTEIEKGLFVDQRWMDLAPGLFSSVYIHRDPGCDVAYWNLNHRHIEKTSEGYVVNGAPLKFFHFSGFSADAPENISIHQTRFTLSKLRHLEPLFYHYRDRLLANEDNETRRLPYAYGYFDNGVRIPEVARYLWREVDGRGERWPDPFKTGHSQSFLSWLNGPADNAPFHQPLVTRLALEAYRKRADIWQTYPDVLGQDRWAFVEWFIGHAQTQHNIDAIFVEPMVDSLNRAPRARGRTAVPKLPSMRGNWGRRFYLAGTDVLMRTRLGPPLQRVLGGRFISRVRNMFFSIGAQPGRMAKSRAALPLRPATRSPIGLNVIGYLHTETGMGEGARAILRALHGRGFPVAYTSVQSPDGARAHDTTIEGFPPGHPFDFNLYYVNADQAPVVYNELGPGFFAGKYNIGFWNWELARFPEDWADRFEYFDEIWTHSNFVQSAIALVSPIPVVNVGLPIEVPSPKPPITRRNLGLPEDRFLFLFAFDALSFVERKNPFGVVEAYQRAFAPDFEDTALVIKATNLEKFPQHQEALRQAMDSISGILIDRYLNRAEMNGLFDVCNACVSLHRSEGFGITIAEAMYLGKPAIATGYSGNMDFMSVANSYPVTYHLVELERDYGPYHRGEVWADPDIDDAAAVMRHVFELPNEAALRGARAAADMRRLYSSETVAERIIQRLRYIAQRHIAQGQ